MQVIPIQPEASQTLQTQVGAQNVVINLYYKNGQGLFCDFISNGTVLVTGVIARDVVPLISADYLGFAGNFMFVDTQGANDPDYSDLGTRYQLVYLTAAEYAIIRQ